ncbi:phage tail protein [Leptolyngbya sp. 'hensonii']|uniref:phage tail protein n=1 Tax=Leptolyngbya sp. 'hensonii' TaxID=1922337 RepID=UPI00094FD0A6|nr:phage tail protein [Leptolyngbya sp. 'hensonii']OLP20173.1 phage tail protein [Leptolyngbya sp. 'hensonii']
MTQARSNQILRLQFLPTQVAESHPLASSSGGGDLSMVLHPGESSELIVRLNNQGSESLAIDLRLEGSLPSDWYHIGLEGLDLPVGQGMDAVIYFRIPADYFEQPGALKPDTVLTLDYPMYVLVSYRLASQGQPHLEYTTLTLYIRPRSRYLEHLPVIYREVDFVGRFLQIFEQAFHPVVQTTDVMWAYLDPLTAPEAMLPFLAHWVNWPLDPRWDLVQQRRLIRNALELYRWRGTRRGLRLFLHLYTGLPLDDGIPREEDKHICIQEASFSAFVIGQARLGEEAGIGQGRPYHFIVRLRPMVDGPPIEERFIRRLIEQEKPAFCTYELYLEVPA